MVEAARDRPSTSTSLIVRLKAMEPDAWDQMAAIYYPLVYGWCVRSRLQPSDAADVAQDVFRAVAGGIRNFVPAPPAGTFRGWLAGITRHKLQDHWRQQQRQAQPEGGSDAQRRLAELPAGEPDVIQEPASAGEVARLVRQAAESIRAEVEERTWQAFWRATVEGHSAAEIAAALGMSTNAVYVAKSRVLRRLREQLGDLEI